MHGNHQHCRIAGKGVLHAVAMVSVEIDVQHPLHAALQQGQDGEDRIIEIAEAAGPAWPAVVRATSRVEHDASFEREFGREDRSANSCRGTGEHAWKQRILQGAESEALTRGGGDLSGRVRVAERRDVLGIVESNQASEIRSGRFAQ